MARTVIGRSIVVDGGIQGDEDLAVRGTVKGRIALSAGVVIEGSATVEADIESRSAQVLGQVTGNISAAERVELGPEGRMVGDLRAPRILIADGALFKGNVDMER